MFMLVHIAKILLVRSSGVGSNTVLDLDLISIVSLEPRASTKVESHVNFTESRKV